MKNVKFEKPDSPIVAFDKLSDCQVFENFEDFLETFDYLNDCGDVNSNVDFRTVIKDGEKHLMITYMDNREKVEKTKEIKLISYEGVDKLYNIDLIVSLDMGKRTFYYDYKYILDDKKYTEYPVLIN